MGIFKVHIVCASCLDGNGLVISKDVLLKPYPGTKFKCPECGQEYQTWYDADTFAVTVIVEQ